VCELPGSRSLALSAPVELHVDQASERSVSGRHRPFVLHELDMSIVSDPSQTGR